MILDVFEKGKRLLRQVGPTIFAIPVAEPGVAFWIIVHGHAGAIRAYRFLRQVIHPDRPPAQTGFHLLPRLVVTQMAQHIWGRGAAALRFYGLQRILATPK